MRRRDVLPASEPCQLRPVPPGRILRGRDLATCVVPGGCVRFNDGVAVELVFKHMRGWLWAPLSARHPSGGGITVPCWVLVPSGRRVCSASMWMRTRDVLSPIQRGCDLRRLCSGHLLRWQRGRCYCLLVRAFLVLSCRRCRRSWRHLQRGLVLRRRQQLATPVQLRSGTVVSARQRHQLVRGVQRRHVLPWRIQWRSAVLVRGGPVLLRVHFRERLQRVPSWLLVHGWFNCLPAMPGWTIRCMRWRMR